MNIWFISKYASTAKYAKAPSRLFYIAKESKDLGHSVSFITSDSNHFASYPNVNKTYSFEVEDGIPVCWVKTLKFEKTASIRRVLSWIDFEIKLFFFPKRKFSQPDIVYISSLSIFTIIYGYYLKRRFNSLLIFEIRDIWPLTMTEEGGFSKWHPLVLLIGMIEKFGYKRADLVVGTMPKLDLHVKNIIGSEKLFYCLPLGFNPDNYANESAKMMEDTFEISVPEDKVIVGYAGSMGITNALEPFIKAIKLMDSYNNIHFVLVGSGDLKNGFVKELEGCNNVTFLDRIPQDKVKDFLNYCDILYLSTQNSKVWKYGQSMNKVVEYMLAGKPIIASYNGYPSMIDEAKCGVFIKDNDPENIKSEIIKIALLTKEELIKIGESGRNWIWQNRQYSQITKSFYNFLTLKKIIKN